MRLVLFGDVDKWMDAVDLISKYRSDIEVMAVSALNLGEYAEDDFTASLREVVNAYAAGEIDGIVNLNGENPYYYKLLEELGFKTIYTLPSTLVMEDVKYGKLKDETLIYDYHDVPTELFQIEYHLADHCNLNCKGCTHFSNLVPEPVFADYERFEKDIIQMKKYFSHIHTFFLMGGEPLLNKDFIKFVKVLRKYYEYADIKIVSNGLLLMTLTPETIQCIKDSDAKFSISAYNCLDIDKIKDFIVTNEIQAELRIEKENFSKFINPHGDSDAYPVWDKCFRKNCTFLERGRIAACCMPFVSKYFNNYFDENLPGPESEVIDLYEEGLTGNEIQRRLITPMDRCRYCGFDVEYEWDTSRPPFDKNDWCIK